MADEDYQRQQEEERKEHEFHHIPFRWFVMVCMWSCSTQFNGRDQHGAWRSFSVAAPGGRQVEIFVSLDKNRGTVVRETSTKKVRAALASRLGKIAHADRESGICSIQWEPVAKVLVSATEPVRVQWDLAALADLAGSGSQGYG